MENRNTIEIPSSTILRVIFWVVLAVLLYYIRNVVVVVLFAIILASAVNPFGEWLEKKKISRVLGVSVLYLLVFGIIVLVLSLMVPYVTQEIGKLSEGLPRYIAKISVSLQSFEDSSRYLSIMRGVQDNLDKISQFLQESSQSVFSFLVSIFGGIISFVFIILISFYLAVMKGGMVAFIKNLLPGKYEDYVIDLWKRSEAKLGKWFQSHMLVCLIVGIITFIGLSILNIKFALLLAFLAMVLELVPRVGPIIAAVPAVIIAFLQSPSLGLWTILMYVIIQQVESQVLSPIIFGKTLAIDPVVVVVALMIGAELGGIPGMILSVPVATVLMEIVNDAVEKRKVSKQS